MSGTRRKPGELGPFVEGYRCRLLALGFTPGTIRGQLKVLGQLGRWCSEQGVAAEQLDARHLESIRAAREAAGLAPAPGPRALSQLLDFLRDAGVIAGQDRSPRSGLDDLQDSYRLWLTADRGLAAATVARYVNLARTFLSGHQQLDGAVEVAGLTGGQVNTFLQGECARLSLGSAKGRVTELRALLRYLHLRGLTELALGEAVPPVAGWRDTTVPLSPSVAQVQALLDGCDQTNATCLRDFAILMLLARLGLRSIEVARLELGDVDWRSGDLLSRGKAARLDRMPLPAQVGQALAAYLVSGRPSATEDRHLFVTERAPRRPIRPDLVSDVVRRACRRAGLAEFGAHRLRHALATDLLAQGAALVEVSQVLCHADLATTAVYAKVNIGALRELARPWPGGTR